MTGWHLHLHRFRPGVPVGITTNTRRGLSSGHRWGPLLGHQWGLSHGHGHPANSLTAETVESPSGREAHGEFGERSGETGREQFRHRAPARLNEPLSCFTIRGGGHACAGGRSAGPWPVHGDRAVVTAAVERKVDDGRSVNARTVRGSVSRQPRVAHLIEKDRWTVGASPNEKGTDHGVAGCRYRERIRPMLRRTRAPRRAVR